MPAGDRAGRLRHAGDRAHCAGHRGRLGPVGAASGAAVCGRHPGHDRWLGVDRAAGRPPGPGARADALLWPVWPVCRADDARQRLLEPARPAPADRPRTGRRRTERHRADRRARLAAATAAAGQHRAGRFRAGRDAVCGADGAAVAALWLALAVSGRRCAAVAADTGSVALLPEAPAAARELALAGPAVCADCWRRTWVRTRVACGWAFSST